MNGQFYGSTITYIFKFKYSDLMPTLNTPWTGLLTSIFVGSPDPKGCEVLSSLSVHCLSSSINFSILILFSETTGAIGTKLGMNVLCMFLSKLTFLLLIEYMRKKRPKGVKEGVYCFYMWRVYFSTNLNEVFVFMFLMKFS